MTCLQCNPVVFFEIQSFCNDDDDANEKKSKLSGKLVFEMYGDVVPRTVENFLQIARSDVDELKYEGTVLKMTKDGLYGSAKGSPERSIFGKGRFVDESFSGKAGKHAGFGTLYCMNRDGKGNGTEFHLSTLDKNCSMEKQCVAMGIMIQGHDFLRNLATLDVKRLKIVKCGEQRLASSLACPRNAFAIFCEENKATFTLETSAKLWRTQMSQVQKEKYFEKARKERDIYDAEIEKNREMKRKVEEARRALKEGSCGKSRKGKKRKTVYSTAFNFFCLEKQSTIKKEDGSKTLSEMWEKMDGASRAPYLEMERKEKEERERKRASLIYPLDTPIEFLQDNPKMPTSMSFARYEKYKLAKTMGEYFALGGTRGDVKYDTARGYMRILDLKKKGDESTTITTTTTSATTTTSPSSSSVTTTTTTTTAVTAKSIPEFLRINI